MTAADVIVDGDEQLTRTLGDLKRGLADLTPAHTKAGDQLLADALPRTPRQSGQLASTGRSVGASDEAIVSFDAEYAGHVHNGWAHADADPWLTETADESTTALTDVYVDHVDDLVGHVKGT